METKLRQSEKIFITSILLLMLSIVIIGKVNAQRTSSILASHPISSHQPCKVTIVGEVSKPGTFSVLPGTLLSKVIKKSAPTPFADLKKINMEQRVEESLSIKIDPLEEITITIIGDSPEPKKIVIPAGSKVYQLKKTLKNCDDKNFKSRRFLRDQETIVLQKEIELARKSGFQ